MGSTGLNHVWEMWCFFEREGRSRTVLYLHQRGAVPKGYATL